MGTTVVQLDIKTYEKIEEVLENYALYRLMQDDELEKDDGEILTGENAKAFYQAQKKRYEG